MPGSLYHREAAGPVGPPADLVIAFETPFAMLASHVQVHACMGHRPGVRIASRVADAEPTNPGVHLKPIGLTSKEYREGEEQATTGMLDIDVPGHVGHGQLFDQLVELMLMIELPCLLDTHDSLLVCFDLRMGRGEDMFIETEGGRGAD
mmetsp:Transcript_78356/g.155748  ORF Transcript_78356/g.155748 Transcript_78356/m.155748 type:complete len:149 (+) Transcript_78356:2-448(+)